MRIHLKKLRLIAGTGTTALGLSLAVTTAASAGGFAVREQSTEFQGMLFAGNSGAQDAFRHRRDEGRDNAARDRHTEPAPNAAAPASLK